MFQNIFQYLTCRTHSYCNLHIPQQLIKIQDPQQLGSKVTPLSTCCLLLSPFLPTPVASLLFLFLTPCIPFATLETYITKLIHITKDKRGKTTCIRSKTLILCLKCFAQDRYYQKNRNNSCWQRTHVGLNGSKTLIGLKPIM